MGLKQGWQTRAGECVIWCTPELPARTQRHAEREPGLSTPSKCRDASRSASSSQRDADKARARLERAQANAAAAESAWRASQEEEKRASEALQTALQTARCDVRLVLYH